MYLLGLDFGTTGLRSNVFSEDGVLLSSAYKEHRLSRPHLGWAEINPDEVWADTLEVMGMSISQISLGSEDIGAISYSSIGGSVLGLNKDGKWVLPCIIPYDRRGITDFARFEAKIGEDNYKRITGAGGRGPLQRILWLQRNKRGIYNTISSFMSMGEFAVSKLCGEVAVDYSLAASSGLFDVHSKRWSSELLRAADVDRSQLSKVEMAGTRLEELDSRIAEKMGLAKGVPVILGGYDVLCGVLGSGSIYEGMLTNIIGTTEQLWTSIPEANIDAIAERGLSYRPHVVKDSYGLPLGGVGTSGSILRWYRDTYGQEALAHARKTGKDVYDVLTAEADGAEPGSKGLLFFPYFRNGGALTGITLGHRRGDIIRAVLEGIAFEMRRSMEEGLRRSQIEISELRAVGGGAKSGVWLQIRADVLGRKIRVPAVTEASSLGAAILAGIGVGIYRSAEEGVRRTVHVRREYIPRKRNLAMYAAHYERYKKIAPLLKSIQAHEEVV